MPGEPVGAWAHYGAGDTFDAHVRAREAARIANRDDPSECGMEEVDFELAWQRGPAGMLQGELIAVNVSDRSWRLSGKPGLRMIGLHGGPPTYSCHGVSGELKVPDHVVVAPGGRAVSSVSWSSWDGRMLSRSVVVVWRGGEKVVATSGPTHPEAAAGPPAPGGRSPRAMTMRTSSTWFDVVVAP